MQKSTFKLGQQKHSRKNLLRTLSLMVLILIVALTLALLYNKSKKADTSSDSPGVKSEIEDAESEDTREPNEPEKTPVKYEGRDVNNTEELTGVITYKSVTDGNLVLRTVINQSVASGKCALTLTKGSDVVTLEADILNDPSSSSCMGFDIPVSKLSPGVWNVMIDISDNNNKSGKISDEVTI